MQFKRKKSIKRWHSFACAALAVLMLLSVAVLHINMYTRGASPASEILAAAAVQQVSEQFRQMVDDSFRQLRVAAAAIAEENISNGVMLDLLTESGAFDRAVLLSGNIQYDAQGKESPAQAVAAYITYDVDDVKGKIITGKDGSLQLRMSVESGLEIAGWINPARLHAILSGANAGDYGYALYNAATGAYLINSGIPAQGHYYDTLLQFNENGQASELMHSMVAQACVKDENGNVCCIAQSPTGVKPWSVALFIPEALLQVENDGGSLMRSISIALTIMMILAALAYLMLARLKNREEGEKQRRRLNVNAIMLRRASELGKIHFFVYSKKRDHIYENVDGLHFIENDMPGSNPTNISALAELYGLEETDANHLYDKMRDMKEGERAEMRINCASREKEQLLRFEMRCMEGDPDCVICCIRDCSQENALETRAAADESFRRAMLAKAPSAWEINISRNCWKLVDGKTPIVLRRLGVSTKGWRDYSSDLNGPFREFIHPEDYESYTSAMSLSSLEDRMRSGNTRVTMECRGRARDTEEYEWYRLELRIFRNMENGELMANLFAFNVNSEKNAEMERRERDRILRQTLTALGGIYYGLYYVDLDQDICYTAKSYKGGAASQLRQSFKDAFGDYVSLNVHEDDQAEISRLLDPFQLRRRMTETSHLLRGEYRRRVGDHYEDSAIVVQAARFENGTVRDVVIAMRRFEDKTKAL